MINPIDDVVDASVNHIVVQIDEPLLRTCIDFYYLPLRVPRQPSDLRHLPSFSPTGLWGQSRAVDSQ